MDNSDTTLSTYDPTVWWVQWKSTLSDVYGIGGLAWEWNGLFQLPICMPDIAEVPRTASKTTRGADNIQTASNITPWQCTGSWQYRLWGRKKKHQTKMYPIWSMARAKSCMVRVGCGNDTGIYIYTFKISIKYHSALKYKIKGLLLRAIGGYVIYLDVFAHPKASCHCSRWNHLKLQSTAVLLEMLCQASILNLPFHCHHYLAPSLEVAVSHRHIVVHPPFGATNICAFWASKMSSHNGGLLRMFPQIEPQSGHVSPWQAAVALH